MNDSASTPQDSNPPAKSKSHLFQPGHAHIPGSGRPKGSKSRMTTKLSDALEEAGWPIFKKWIIAIEKGDYDVANAISKAFPYVSGKPPEEIHNVNENKNLDVSVTASLSTEQVKFLLGQMKSAQTQSIDAEIVLPKIEIPEEKPAPPRTPGNPF